MNKDQLQESICEWKQEILSNIENILLVGNFPTKEELLQQLNHECDEWYQRTLRKLQ